jgi:hypothetical protein
MLPTTNRSKSARRGDGEPHVAASSTSQIIAPATHPAIDYADRTTMDFEIFACPSLSGEE